MTQETSVIRRKPIQPGERNAYLVAVKRVGEDRWRAALWQFRCNCGNENYIARPDQVRRGMVISCGCQRSEKASERMRSRSTHGHSRNGKLTSEYNSWRNMIGRCADPENSSYSSHGGRGIAVCERWLDFRNFLYDIGAKPNVHYTVDRIDNDGDYTPTNCRWASKKEQARNKSNTHVVTYAGREMSLAEACERAGVSRNAVDARMRRGWSAEKSLTTPVKFHRPRSV